MEVYLQRYLDHPNVIQLHDFFEYQQAYVLILERPVHYRDLFDFITENKRLDEHEAKSIFKQVILDGDDDDDDDDDGTAASIYFDNI